MKYTYLKTHNNPPFYKKFHIFTMHCTEFFQYKIYPDIILFINLLAKK